MRLNENKEGTMVGGRERYNFQKGETKKANKN